MIVSKATSVYAITVVVLVGGLWMILALGSTLITPTDIAGKWELMGDAGPKELWVEQSGKFVNLVMGSWKANLQIRQDASPSPTQTDGIVMNGNGETVTFDGLAANDQCTIRFDGLMTGVYQAHRTFRAFR